MNNQPTVIIVDDDREVRQALRVLLESMQFSVEAFASARRFLNSFDASRPGCLLLDLQMPGVGGLQLLEQLGRESIHPPVIFLSAYGDAPTVVQAMKAGAVDFIEKPCHDQQLREAIQEALRQDADNRKQWARKARIQRRLAQLATGEREVLAMLIEGKSNKAMAQRLGLSVRTIEVRRAKLMRKMKARSLAELVRMTLVAEDPPGMPDSPD